MGQAYFLLGIAFIVVFILIIRLFGAWMLRINIVIRELKGLRSDLKEFQQDYLIKQKAEPKTEPKIKEPSIKTDLPELNTTLKDDEMIVKIKETGEVKTITKEEFETAKELHLSNKYTVIDDNNQTSNKAKLIYTSARLTFKRDEIEPLDWDDIIRIYVSNEGRTYQMTKREFYEVFDNVVQTKSYKEYGNYNCEPTPSKANQFIVAN